MSLPRYTHMLGRAAGKVPGLKQVPIVKLLLLGEVALLARDHYERLTPAERHRLIALMRDAKGRPSTLTDEQHAELAALVAKAAPRQFAAEAVDKLSPVPIPGLVKKRLARSRRAARQGARAS